MAKAGNIQAFGPWVMIKADPHKEKTEGGLYRPQGNLEDRTGLRIGTVMSVGQGQFNLGKNGKPPKSKFTHSGLKEGDRVLFRGFLHDVSRYHQGIEGLDHSMVSVDDVLGVVEDEDGDVVL